MKILLLNYEYPPLGGGAANATKYILEEYKHIKNIEVHAIVSSIGKHQIEQLAPHITVHKLDIGKNNEHHHQSMLDIIRYSIKAYRYAKKMHANSKFDLIHAFFGIPCGYIASKLHIPYIVSLRGSDVPFYNDRFAFLDKWIFQHLSKRIWKKANAVIANSTHLRDLALQTSPDQEIGIVRNGVDTTHFFPIEKKRTLDEPVQLLTVSRLVQRKNIHLVIDAVEVLQQQYNIHFTIVGSGKEQEALEKRIVEKNLQSIITLAGAIGHKDLPTRYATGDIFLLVSEHEGMSNTVLEAIASGLPLILSDTGEAEMLCSGNGIIVNPHNQSELITGIEKLISDQELRKTFAKASRKKAESLSWKAAAQAYIDKYNQIVSNS